MPSQHPSRSSILTDARPLCTAVKGCTRKAAQVSFELPGGKRARICAMHLMRVRRTGEVGGPGSGHGLGRPRKRQEAAAREALRNLRSCAGTDWRILSDGPGWHTIVGVTRRQAPERCSTSTLRAIERRGWLKIGAWKADGSRSGAVTGLGVKALEA